MISEAHEAIGRADEALGRVRLDQLDDVARMLDKVGTKILAQAVLEAASHVAAARRILSRSRPVPDETAKGKA